MHTAMILAAGRGERLRPITDTCPKAMCSIQGVPLIEYHVLHLAAADIRHIVINLGHLGGKIRQHLGHGGRFGVEISYAPEPPGALETGGGIVNALPQLGPDHFITVNADIFTDYPLRNLHRNTAKLAHLVLVPTPVYADHADFGITATAMLSNTDKQYIFSGIACYHPAVFAHAKPGRYSVTPILRHLIDEHHVSGEVYSGQWFDIGTPERLAALQSMPG